MKKITVAGVIMLLTSFSVAFGEVELSPRLGINMAGLVGDDVPEGRMKAALVGGIAGEYSINENISIQPEVLYSQKGGIAEELSIMPGADIEIDVSYDYLDIPVLVKYNISTSGDSSPSVYGGPSIGILLSAEQEFSGDDWDDSLLVAMGEEEPGNTMDVKDHLKATDFALVVGAGTGIKLTKGTLILDARYTLGLTSIDDSGEEQDIKNSVISATVGYKF